MDDLGGKLKDVLNVPTRREHIQTIQEFEAALVTMVHHWQKHKEQRRHLHPTDGIYTSFREVEVDMQQAVNRLLQESAVFLAHDLGYINKLP